MDMVQDRTDIEDAIESRYSCRAFLRDKPVARQDIEDIIRVASRAASSTNTQPWKVYVLQDDRRDALVAQVCPLHEAVFADPSLARAYSEDYDYYPKEWKSPFIDRRRQNGWGLYGTLGIGKGDREKIHAQAQRNYRFFDAPVGLMFTLDRSMGRGSLIDYGMFLQNLMIAARVRGLHTCPQAAWNHYAKVVLPFIGAAEEEMLVCGMSLGYADEAAPVNSYRTPREKVDDFARWV
jgi:nitroreductase